MRRMVSSALFAHIFLPRLAYTYAVPYRASRFSGESLRARSKYVNRVGVPSQGGEGLAHPDDRLDGLLVDRHRVGEKIVGLVVGLDLEIGLAQADQRVAVARVGVQGVLEGEDGLLVVLFLEVFPPVLVVGDRVLRAGVPRGEREGGDKRDGERRGMRSVVWFHRMTPCMVQFCRTAAPSGCRRYRYHRKTF